MRNEIIYVQKRYINLSSQHFNDLFYFIFMYQNFIHTVFIAKGSAAFPSRQCLLIIIISAEK